MSEEKFPASFLIHNTAKIDSVHWSKHELFEKLQVLLFSFLAGTFITFASSRYVDRKRQLDETSQLRSSPGETGCVPN